MLNKVSVLDILASIIRKAKVIICLMVISAIAFGFLKFYRNGSASAAASQKLSALETAVKNADTAYTNLNDRVKTLPIAEINTKSTWVASVVYGLSADGKEDEYARDFFNALKRRWDADDLSKVTTDLFSKTPDDEGVREVVDLSMTDDRKAVLTIKAKNKAQCVSLYYVLNELIMGYADEQLPEPGENCSLVQEGFVIKKTNDSELNKKQEYYKERLAQLEANKDEKHTQYDKVAIEANRKRGAKKWAVAGAALVFIISLALAVCRACIYEPALSATHVSRETKLEYLGTVKKRIGLLEKLAARVSGEKLKDAETEAGKLISLLKRKETADQLTLVAADGCGKSKKMEKLFAGLKESGFNTENRTEDTVIMDKVSDIPAVLVLKKDRTTIKEAGQLESLAEGAGYKVEGFVFT